MNNLIIDVKALNAHYGLGHVLQDLSLHVGKECVAVMGRNGVGKTTLARSLVGLNPPQASGSVELLGHEVIGLPPYRIAQLGVGYVPQGRRLFPSLSVDEHLQLSARRGPAGNSWSPASIYELFPSLGKRRSAYGDQLSGGERSMLAIARALVTNPGCLILDEPTEGLAPSVVEDVALSLKKLSGEGVAVLLIEQNVKAAVMAASRAYYMADGQIAHETEPGAPVADEATLNRYLGVSI
jgi:branched-chain amino acid transport system ATP-binding protein